MKPGNCSVFVKGNALIPNVPKDYVIKCICEQEYRVVWDKILNGFTVFKTDRDDI